MINYKLLTVLAFILTFAISFDDAFAAAGSAYTPTQTNAYTSYNNSTNQIQISWNFNTMTPGDKCVIKADIEFQARATVDESPRVAIAHYIPNYYSAISSSPTLLGSSSSPAEEVECENASFRIDLNTIMNSSLNPDSLSDLMIFLTFYATDDLTKISLQNEDRIDEVFVVYSPNAILVNGVINDGTDQIQWSCDKQIGSVLYIDQSGSNDSVIAHVNNGDNCTLYEYVENNQWIDIGMANSYPDLALGVTANGFHNEPFFSLLYQVVGDIIAIVNGGSSDDHNSRPTFGIDYKTFTQLVDEGLVINDKVYTVTDNYWTPMDMLSLEVGVTQNFTSTVFAPHQLKILEFGFGIPEVGKWDEAEASIEIETNYDGDILDYTINESDKDNPLINPTILEFSVSKVKCNANDNTEPCYRVSVEFSFLEPPIGEVIAIQAIDNERKNQILYFNDGIKVTGESLNPPTVQQIISEIKYKGLQTIQRIDKVNDVWMTLDKSEPVLLYKQNNHGTFIPLEYRTFEHTTDKIKMNMDRLNSNFKDIIQYEIKRATELFDSNLIQGQDPTSWSYVYPIEGERINDNTKQTMKEQEELAKIILEAK